MTKNIFNFSCRSTHLNLIVHTVTEAALEWQHECIQTLCWSEWRHSHECSWICQLLCSSIHSQPCITPGLHCPLYRMCLNVLLTFYQSFYRCFQCVEEFFEHVLNTSSFPHFFSFHSFRVRGWVMCTADSRCIYHQWFHQRRYLDYTTWLYGGIVYQCINHSACSV